MKVFLQCAAPLLLALITPVFLACSCTKKTDEAISQEVVAGLGRDAGGVYGHSHHLQPLTGIFETLVSYGYDCEIIPQLATSWNVSDDRLTWTFHLREGVLFHDGTLFDAKSARHALEMLSKRRPGHLGPVASIEAVDKYRLQITHTEPYAPLLYELAWFFFSMAAPSAFDEEGNIVVPVGTGPFKSGEWIPDEKMVLVRNGDYWGTSPVLEKITLRNIPDPSTRILALEAGEIDLIIDSGGVLPDDVQLLEKDPEIEVLQRPQPMSLYLLLNCKTPPFQDPLARRALLYGVDKYALVKDLLGVGKAATSILPESALEWHCPAFEDPHDPDRARELLEEAGWVDRDGDGLLDKDGDSFKVVMLLSTQQIAMGPDRMVAEAVQSQLGEIGIAVDIEALENGAYYDRGGRGNGYHIMLWCYPFLGPHNVLYRSFHSKGDWNLRGNFYRSPRMDDLLDLAKRTFEKDKRRQLYQDAQRLLSEEAPIIPLYEAVLINAVRTHVKGYKLHPWFVVNWGEIHVEPRARDRLQKGAKG